MRKAIAELFHWVGFLTMLAGAVTIVGFTSIAIYPFLVMAWRVTFETIPPTFIGAAAFFAGLGIFMIGEKICPTKALTEEAGGRT